MDTDQVDRVIAGLYEAAADPSYWESSLSLLTNAVGGFASTFAFADLKAPRASFAASTDGFSDEALRLYGAYYGALDEARDAVYRIPVGQLFMSQEAFDDRYVSRSEFMNEFLIPQGGRYIAGTCLINDERLKVSIGVHRNLRQGPFGAEQKAVLGRVLPHFTQATRLAHRLNQLRAENCGLAAGLDRVPWGVVIAGTDGRVTRANAAATALLVKSDGLTLRNGRLETASSDATQALQTMICEAGRTSRGRGGEAGGSMAIARPSDGGRLMVVVAPLSEVGSISLGVVAPGAIVFIADPATRPIAPTQAIAQAFGLTPAEARLAVALASGDSLEEIADRHGLSKNTVRVQLQSVFAKTGTRRQAELAALVLGVPSLVRGIP